LAAIYLGGWVFAGTVALILLLASLEIVKLFRAGGFNPALVIVLISTLLLVISRQIDEFTSSPWILSLILLTSMAYHLIQYERGKDQSLADFALTFTSSLYIGWLGAYLISLRNSQDGMWWMLLVLPAIWIADGGAYIIGKRFGKHHITPRLSPKKTWEGYIGGIIVGTLGVTLLALLYQYVGAMNTSVTTLSAAIIGFVVSVLGIFGDLGESMIKRQVGIKDSGNILPGHGGVFDRIDSWLWAAVIGYYLISWFFI